MALKRSTVPTCAAHLILAGMTGWSIKQLPAESGVTGAAPFMLILLIYILVHSLFGIFRHSHPDPKASVRKLYDHSTLLTIVCPLAFLNTTVYLKYDPSQTHLPLLYVYLTVSVLVPFTAGFIYSKIHQRHKGGYVSTAMNLINLAILTWISIEYDNIWGLGLAISHGIKLFTLPKFVKRYNVVDLYIYGLVFFQIFAINVITDAEQYRTEISSSTGRTTVIS